MELINRHKELVVFGVITAAMLAVLATQGSFTEQKDRTDVKAATEKTAQTDTNQNNNTKADYTYTVQDGDTYSYLARKAVQTYGITDKVNMSQAEIIAAETNLTIQAGSPLVNAGEKVTIERSKVRSAVEAARKMTAEQEAQWQAYVPTVNFRTNEYGQ